MKNIDILSEGQLNVAVLQNLDHDNFAQINILLINASTILTIVFYDLLSIIIQTWC